MAIFVPNSPLAGFNVSTGSLQGPLVQIDSLTGASVPTFLINGGAVGNEFFISSSNFNVKANGDITASNASLSGTITAAAGEIGGWTIASTTLSKNGVTLDSANGQIRTATNYTTGDGFFLGSAATNNFRVGLAGGSRLQFTGTNIEIYDSSTRVVSLGTVNEIAGFGLTPAAISSSNNQLVLRSNGQITGSSVLFNGGRIGGFTIDSTKITGSNIVIDSAGSIQTANYTPDLIGWKIDAAGNGTAEFENVKIRGTLSTAVFEKQSVNAVGGQLYVANSTTLTGSGETGASTNGQYTATQTTMSVENVTGFEANEILSAKRFSGTGFATEYMRINSASRANPSSQTDFSGRIYVTRALGSGTSGVSSSLGETPSAGQPYSGSQVIVSTGKLGTGFIRINANPNDTATPYIDIVERTGSGVYDVKLKARLGDLSGLSGSSYVFGQSNPGFGLATDNVFLQGGITATFGSIGGFSISSTTISSSNDDLILRSNGQITGSSVLFDGGKIGGFTLDSSKLTAVSNLLGTSIPTIDINGTTGAISGSNVLLRRRISGTTYTLMDTENGIADFRNLGRQVIADDTEYIRTSTNDETTNYTDLAEWSFNILPGETDLLIGWNWLTHSATYNAVSRLRWQLAYLSAAQSGSSTTSAAFYNTWTSGSTSAHTLSILANNSGSAWEVPNSTIGRNGADFDVSSYEGSIIRIRLQLANDIANATGNMTTKVRDVCAYTTRTYGVAAAGGLFR